jgi:hypothetical protein
MVEHGCSRKSETEREKTMQTFILPKDEDETEISTMTECAKQFHKWHATQSEAKTNLDAIKRAIKSEPLGWFRLGISVTVATPETFNEDLALGVLDELGATTEQIAGCYKKGNHKVVSKAK